MEYILSETHNYAIESRNFEDESLFINIMLFWNGQFYRY